MQQALTPMASRSGHDMPPTPWVPIVVASGAATLAALWLGLWLLALTVLPSALPDGVDFVGPSGLEIAFTVIRRVGEPLLAAGLLVPTWRSGVQGRATACWLACLATVGVSAISILL